MKHSFKHVAVAILGLVLLLNIAACGGGGSEGTELSTNACGDLGLPTKNSRIINGTACGNLAASPVVRVVMYDALQIPLGYCTGTLISSNAVLTAAHCAVAGTVSAGIFYGDSPSTFVSVSKIHRHPGYTPIRPNSSVSAAFNDVAVYFLRENLNLPILPIATSAPVLSGDVIDIYGYGTDENGNLDFKDLKAGQMLVENTTGDHISTIYNGDGSNTCQGDSGGPATIRLNGITAVVGVTSTGTNSTCGEGDNSLFINLQNPGVLNFILSEVPAARTI